MTSIASALDTTGPARKITSTDLSSAPPPCSLITYSVPKAPRLRLPANEPQLLDPRTEEHTENIIMQLIVISIAGHKEE